MESLTEIHFEHKITGTQKFILKKKPETYKNMKKLLQKD